MRILMCFSGALTRTLGASKVYVEVANAVRDNGHTCDLVGPDTILSESEKEIVAGRGAGEKIYRQALKRFLQDHAGKYDVVEYEHTTLPYPRSEFSQEPLFVARSVLLQHHLSDGILPSSAQGIPSLVKRFLTESISRVIGTHRQEAETKVPYKRLVRLANKRVGLIFQDDGLSSAHLRRLQATVREADLVNVSNRYDKDRLLDDGIPEWKIRVFPFGMTIDRLRQFRETASEKATSDLPRVAFIGTFDLRKGCTDFPELVERVVQEVPDVHFRLLGTKGWLVNEHEVLACFPPALRSRVEVVPSFSPEKLPGLLADCSAGVFPSYLEGFGFGVLEMLAAGLPVVAYDAPGPPEMLPSKWLVESGNVEEMSSRIANLLTTTEEQGKVREEAQSRAGEFVWTEIAERTVDEYEKALRTLKKDERFKSVSAKNEDS